MIEGQWALQLIFLRKVLAKASEKDISGKKHLTYLKNRPLKEVSVL